MASLYPFHKFALFILNFKLEEEVLGSLRGLRAGFLSSTPRLPLAGRDSETLKLDSEQ